MAGWKWLLGGMLVLGVVAALSGLDRLGLWLEARGWLSYRKKKPSSSPASCLVAMQQLVEPGARHVVQLKQERRSEAERADRERLLAGLLACLAAAPVDVEQVRHLLGSARRAGLDWRRLHEEAVQVRRSTRPDLADLVPPLDALGPLE